MKRFFFIFFICLYAIGLSAQEGPADRADNSDTVMLPVNVYDSFYFSKESSAYIRTGLYIFGPGFFLMYGFTTWGWDIEGSFAINSETYRGEKAVHGAADKFGHLYSTFVIKRISTFMFRASGSSRNRANLEGAVLSEFIMAASELGDGFSKEYGFDPYDLLFNNIGILIGMILDWSPVLDRIFTLQFEYVPTREMRESFDIVDNHDLPTDYGGTKYMLTTKLGGIPYLYLTPLRYLNIDLGYYSRGYDQKYVNTKTRNIYLGFSFNFSIAFGDLLPVGYASSTIQSFFNYYHPPWDYEAKRWKLSEIPNENYEE